jgi:NADPH:quinone reductase-like Zn-dependent oxidoreductase
MPVTGTAPGEARLRSIYGSIVAAGVSIPTPRGWAFVMEEFGGLPRRIDREVPRPGRDETLVEVCAAQVAHLDSDVVAGTFGLLPALPFVPGTEAAGRVVRSAALPVGTRVRVRGAGVGTARDGTWASHVIAPDSAVHRLPPDVDDVVACCAFSPACTAWAAVHDVGEVGPGQRVLITGASGAVGGVAGQLAAAAGADVTGWVSREEKLPHVPAPARPVVVASAGPPERAYDVVVDTVGGEVLVDALRRISPGGVAVLVGYTAGRRVEVDLQELMLADVSLRPINLIRRTPGLLAVFDALLRRISRGEIVLPVERYPTSDLSTALDRLRSGRIVGKAALDVTMEVA